MFPLNTKILIVDDMMTMRKLVSKIFRDLGFTDISDASDGALAWQAISTSNPPFGLVISDWNMPQCTGLELLKRVRNDPRFAKLPFVLVTAEAEQHQIVEAIKSGVNGYVVKPFTAESIKEKLEMVHKKFGAKVAT